MAGEWIDQLPSDLKGNEAFTVFETLGDFAKAHLDTAGKVTELDGNATELTGKVTDLEGRVANSIPKLSETSTPEEKAAFFKALGVPEKSTDYEFSAADGVEHDPKMIEWAKGIFHKANLNADQAGVISAGWDGFVTEMGKAQKLVQEEAVKEANEKLKTEWGSDYDKKLELTKRAFTHFSGEEFDKFLVDTGIGNHPAFIKAFHAIGAAMGEDFSPQGKGPGSDETVPGMKYDMPDFEKK